MTVAVVEDEITNIQPQPDRLEVPDMSERMLAILEWMGGEHGYGFMIEENGKQVFIRYTPLPGESFRILTEGSECSFSVVDGPRGRMAAEIHQTPPVYTPRRTERNW